MLCNQHSILVLLCYNPYKLRFFTDRAYKLVVG